MLGFVAAPAASMGKARWNSTLQSTGATTEIDICCVFRSKKLIKPHRLGSFGWLHSFLPFFLVPTFQLFRQYLLILYRGSSLLYHSFPTIILFLILVFILVPFLDNRHYETVSKMAVKTEEYL